MRLAAILQAIQAIGQAFSQLFAWLSQGRLIEAGKAEAERDQLRDTIARDRETEEKARRAAEEVATDPDDDVVAGRMRDSGF